MREWIVADGETGRLDMFLHARGVRTSRAKAQEMVRAGLVLVNGRIARKGALVLKEGDRVQCADDGAPVTETRLTAVDLQLAVLYEDAACLVVLKPAGLPVHPGAGLPPDAVTLLHGIVHLFAQRAIPFASAATLVHRLDKDTTGCLLVAKTPEAHAFLQKQFEQRTVQKTYLALVVGHPDPPAAMIDAAIGRSVHHRTQMTVFGAGRTRTAQTSYETLAMGAQAALLRCHLHTGRTHQIRVHLSAIGHPILGDGAYATPQSEAVSKQHAISSICLHAWRLTFASPADGASHTVEVPPGDGFVRAATALGITLTLH